MTSDRAGSLDVLAAVLGRAGEEPPTGTELAELLWLARHMRVPERAAPDAQTAAAPTAPSAAWPTATAPPAAHSPVDPAPAEAPEPPPPRPHVPPETQPLRPARVPLRTPATGRAPAPEEPASQSRHTPLLAPAPPMLSHPLALQRSLRPFRRTVPSATRRELDESATAHRIATLGAGPGLWLPVLRPQRERWLHLRLVVDSGPTMTMWRPLVRELHTALAQTGAFRTLDVLRLGEDGRLPRRHRELGRTTTLVVSDCMGPQWREGPAGLRWRSTLAALGRELPVAVLQPLPERLWRYTAAPPLPGLFFTPGPGVPNSALDFAPYHGGPSPAGVPLPVLEPSGAWLGNWAALVASPGGTEVPGAAAFVGAGGLSAERVSGYESSESDETFDPEESDPEDLVLRFRAIASPQAFRLAAHLAVGSAHLPVMRLVQAAVEEHPQPQHLAEVVLSGMLRTQAEAVPGAYEFRPGVREVLLGTLPRTTLVGTTGLLARISAEIESRAGALPGEFQALVESLAPAGGGRTVGRPFALVSEESIRLLRGPERGGATGKPSPAGSSDASPSPGPEGEQTGASEREEPTTSGPEETGATGPEESTTTSGPASGPEESSATGPESASFRLNSDRYELVERLEGGSAEMWLAHDRYLNHSVAVWFFPFPPEGERLRTGKNGRDERSAAADFLARTYEVARIVSPHLLRVFDAVVLDEGCCVITERVHGRTLARLLATDPGLLPVDKAVSVAQDILRGLWALHHGPGIAHGDLTPAKVMGIDDGVCRLADYGLRWPYSERPGDPDRTAQYPLEAGSDRKTYPGTARYMAPERQSGIVLPESDLYALGCILFEMLTGAPPFPGSDLTSVLAQHVGAVPPDPAVDRPDIPPELGRAVTSLLAKEPRERQRGATALSQLRRTTLRRYVPAHYQLLGPPRAAVKGADVSAHAFQDNAFLCRLLLARGAPVSTAQMAEALGDRSSIHPSQYALHLTALGLPVRTEDGAFRLPVAETSLDVARAESHAERADRALDRGDRTVARKHLDSALALWYGEPLDGIKGPWAEAARDRLRQWHAELVEKRDALDRSVEASPGWLVIRRPYAAPSLPAEYRDIVAGLARQALGGVRGRPHGWDVLRTPLPPGFSAESVVEWAVGEFPQDLARLLPPHALSQVRLNIVVHEDTEEEASALGDAADVQVADAGRNVLLVTVLISHGLRARLPRARQREFDRITATARGWHRVVVVEPPDGPADGTAGSPVLSSSEEPPPGDLAERETERRRGWFSGLAARLTGDRSKDGDKGKGLPEGPETHGSGTVVRREADDAPDTDASRRNDPPEDVSRLYGSGPEGPF
ncbi:SAV_2336 N-terminal domain-related protein [Streptomyces sp. NPDC046316]|uniref:SAV_2336 N-terminal domain-related protein n=1 Tax=Streptomyces sp. NPDC046316 TaxID=3154494 RepID=UPI0033D5946E